MEKLKKIALIIIFILFDGYLLFTGIYDLVDTKNHYTYTISSVKSEYTVKQYGDVQKDLYFYRAYTTDSEEITFPLHASPLWESKNFDHSGNCLNENGITINAALKHNKKLENFQMSNQAAGIKNTGGEYLEISYIKISVHKILFIFWSIAFAAICKYTGNSINEHKNNYKYIILILLLLASGAYLIYNFS